MLRMTVYLALVGEDNHRAVDAVRNDVLVGSGLFAGDALNTRPLGVAAAAGARVDIAFDRCLPSSRQADVGNVRYIFLLGEGEAPRIGGLLAVGSRQGDGAGIASYHIRADGDRLRASIGLRRAAVDGVGTAGGVAEAKGKAQRIVRELAAFHGNGRYRDGLRRFVVKNRDAGASDQAGNCGCCYRELIAGNLIRVVARSCQPTDVGYRYVLVRAGTHDKDCAMLTGRNGNIVADAISAFLAREEIMEVVDCSDFRSSVMRAAFLAGFDLCLQCRGWTREIQSRSVVEGSRHRICTVNDVLGKDRFFVIGICVMALRPVQELVGGNPVVDPEPISAVEGRGLAFAETPADLAAKAAVRDGHVIGVLLHEALGLFLVRVGRANQDLTVVVHAGIDDSRPEVRAFGRKADVLRGIPADTVDAHALQLLNIGFDLVLDGCILGVKVRKADTAVYDPLAIRPHAVGNVALCMPEISMLVLVIDLIAVADIFATFLAVSKMVRNDVNNDL